MHLFQKKYADEEFGRNFTYSNITTTPDKDIQNLNMSAYLASGCNIVLSNYLYAKETTINIGGKEKVLIRSSSLKFNIYISGWKFLEKNHILHFHMSIFSSRSKDAEIIDHGLRINGSQNDTLYIEFPKMGIVDRITRNITVEFDIPESDPDGFNNFVDVAVIFPHFNEVIYDPDVGIFYAVPKLTDSEKDFSVTALILMGIAGLLIATFGSGVAFLVWKRAQTRQRYIRYY